MKESVWCKIVGNVNLGKQDSVCKIEYSNNRNLKRAVCRSDTEMSNDCCTFLA